MGQLKRWLLKKSTQLKYQRFIKDTKCPQKAVQKLWNKEIYPLIKKSAYWRAKIKENGWKNLNQFEITSYSDYENALIEAQPESISLLNGEEIYFWSETSGTTGNRKFFPITSSFQRQFQRTMAPYFYSLLERYQGFLQNKILYLAAWDTGDYSEARIQRGLISYYNYHNLPGLIRSYYAIPKEIFRDQATFEQWAPIYALATDLSAVFAIVPIVVDSFTTQCINNFLEYLPYLIGDRRLPEDLPQLDITDERKRYLTSIQGKTTQNLKTLWPGLVLIGCWTEGSCRPYAEYLKSKISPDISLVDGTYSATEGWLTVPISNEHVGGVLHPGTHIVEFIEENKPIQKENLLQSLQLETNKRYEVFLTTAMGFVRYRLQDVVECTGFYNQVPILVFCHKVAQLLLCYGALTEAELRQALSKAQIVPKPYWYFACDKIWNRLYFVIDDESEIPKKSVLAIHEALIEISEKYGYEAKSGAILPCVLIKKSKKELLQNHHAQTKPKIISQAILNI